MTRGLCTVTCDQRLEHIVELSGIEKDGDAARYLDADGTSQALTGREPVSMNMWGFHPSVFAHFQRQFADFLRTSLDAPKSELVIPTAIADLVTDGRAVVRLLHTPSTWFGMTHPEDRAAVKAQILARVEAGEYPPSLWG